MVADLFHHFVVPLLRARRRQKMLSRIWDSIFASYGCLEFELGEAGYGALGVLAAAESRKAEIAFAAWTEA